MSRPRLLHGVWARPYLILAALLGGVAYLALPGWMTAATRAILAWDLFVISYLAAITIMMLRSNLHDIRCRAALYDQGALAILALSVAATIASIVAVVVEMATATSAGRYGAWQIGLSALTVSLSWAFVHTIFALHYAHDFYSGAERETLRFPGEEKPLYGEFMYFSFVIGCACATADVEIKTRGARRIAAIHGIIAFVFNTAIVALSINIAAGLIGK